MQSLATNHIWYGYDIGTASTSTSATTNITATEYMHQHHHHDFYTNKIIHDQDLLTRYRSTPKYKKKSLEEKLQSEIDKWLSVFD